MGYFPVFSFLLVFFVHNIFASEDLFDFKSSNKENPSTEYRVFEKPKKEISN